MDIKTIRRFMNTIACIYGLSKEHGAAMSIMLTSAFKSNGKLALDTPLWRSYINNVFGWKTDKPSTRILRDLERVGFIQRAGRYVYTLNSDIFGDDYWNLISTLGITVDFDKNGRVITIQREYKIWTEEDMEDENE